MNDKADAFDNTQICCGQNRIKCDINMRVLQINWSYKNLSGQISQNFANITNLERL
jgi:hypothetical protein